MNTPLQFIAEPDPVLQTIALILFGVFAVIIFIASAYSRRGQSFAGGNRRREFRRRCKARGITNAERRLLEDRVRRANLADPLRLFSSDSTRRRFMSQIMSDIQSSQAAAAVKEQRRSMVLRITAKLALAESGGDGPTPSTTALRQGEQVRIRPAGGQTYTTIVTSNVRDLLGLEIPTDRRGRPVELTRGTPLTVTLVHSASRAFSYETKIQRVQTIEGIQSLFVPHARELRGAQQRKSPRVAFTRPAFFYPVEVVSTGSGRNAETRTIVNRNRRTRGDMVDISAGGCALVTRSPIPAGKLVRVDFDASNGSTVVTYGKVLSMESAKRGMLMHIKFTRVSRSHLNQIREYVFGLTEA